jgi:membrane protein
VAIRAAIFVINLVVRCARGGVFDRANGLAFRVLLAFFPFLVFLIALLGFMELDSDAVMGAVAAAMPGDDTRRLVEGFLTEFTATRAPGLLGGALFFALWNTANGFRAIQRMAALSYDARDARSVPIQFIISIAMMMLFAIALVSMVALIAFARSLAAFAVAFAALIAVTAAIFRLAAPIRRLRLRHILPGAIAVVAAWAVVGSVFGFIVANFTQLPAIYGSIAGIFILIIWLDIVSVILLVGFELNALLWEFSNSSPFHPQIGIEK